MGLKCEYCGAYKPDAIEQIRSAAALRDEAAASLPNAPDVDPKRTCWANTTNEVCVNPRECDDRGCQKYADEDYRGKYNQPASKDVRAELIAAHSAMPRRWCSVHNQEEFKYESLEHELAAATTPPSTLAKAAAGETDAVVLQIPTCAQCPFVDHSGAFTPGGAKAICNHRNAIETFAANIEGEDRYHWKYRQVNRNAAPPAQCPLRVPEIERCLSGGGEQRSKGEGEEK